MLLSLLPIFNGTKKQLEFSQQMDVSSLELPDGSYPLTEPVLVQGVVENNSDCVTIHITVDGELHVSCARCNEPLVKPLHISFTSVIVRELANEEDEGEVIVLEGYELDMDELVFNQIVLNIDMRYLCSEECKGLCPVCGTNLNHHTCNCEKKITDPRLAVLSKLLQ
jgi:uncharacterized protein